MEFVCEVNGADYYIDSSVSPAEAASALKSIDGRVILISCGYGDDAQCDPLGPVLAEKAKHFILLGHNASILEMALLANLKGKNAYNDVRITHCSTLDEAVYAAYFSAKKGDSVLFSSGGAGDESFKSSGEAHEKFRELLNGIR